MERKKVGILTFHRAFNHGAMLQCYALYKTIEKLGHKPQIIDYRQPHIEKQYVYANKITTINEIEKVLLKPRWLPGFLFNIIPHRIRKAKRRWKLFKGLSFSKRVTSAKEMPQNLKTIVIGSDQVWANYCTNGIDKIFYGSFPHKNTRVIGYAISSNIASLEETGTKSIKELCNNFQALSFREEEIKEYLEESIGINSQIVLDPTLLLNNCDWEQLINDKEIKYIDKKYILTFFLNHEFNLEHLYKNIELFAQKEQCEIIELSDAARTPIEFINWIKNAKYIITSSFHTIVFSIIFKKDFYAIKTNNGKDIRYINLLNKLELQERIINYNELNTTNCISINYNNVETILENERKFSIDFLRNNI